MEPESIYPFIIGLLLATTIILFLELRRERGTTRGGRVPPAEVWLPDMETPSHPRLVRDATESDPDSPSWTEGTVEKGVLDLMSQYRDQGVPISEKEAREEVMLMLNAEGGEI